MFEPLAVKSSHRTQGVWRRRAPRPAALILLFALAVSLTACLPFFGSDDDPDATITALQATINAVPVATATSPATATLPPTATPLPPTAAPPTQPPPPTAAAVTQPAAAPGNIEELILNSNVLLFEDMAGNEEVFRYVAAAMQRLGFRDGSYYDTGDAQGRLLEQMSGNAPNGRPWDLIIIANEDTDGIQGTFYEVLEGVLNTGKTAVIHESWHLDEIHQGAVKPILLRCGVDVVNWAGSSSASLKVFPLDSGSPLLSEIVNVNSFNVLDYWGYYYDLGDLMYLTGTGDARLVAGAEPGTTNQGGVLAECYNGRLILQTLSSHNYTDDTMVSLWANYIHYALRRLHGG